MDVIRKHVLSILPTLSLITDPHMGEGGSDKKKLECGSFRPCVEELRYYGHHVMVKKFKKIGFTEDVITRDKTEYSSHALAEVVDGKTGMSES